MSAEPVRPLDLRKLRYFIAVAEELHFGRAAQRVYVTQPVLSRQVRLLELEIGVDLIDRTSRTVALTEAGACLLSDGRELIAASEAARARAVGAAQTRPSITVGIWGVEWLAETIRHFRTGHPESDVQLHRVSWDTQEDLLRTGRIDVLFAVLPIDERGLGLVPFSRERRHAIVSSRHPIADQDSVSIQELSGDPVIIHGGASPQWQAFHSVDPRPDGQHPKSGPVANDFQAKLELIAAGETISFLPESAVMTNPWPGAKSVPVTDIPPLEMYLAWDARIESPLIDDFVRLVRDLGPRELPAGFGPSGDGH